MIFVDFSPLAIQNNLKDLSGTGKKEYPNPEQLRILMWAALGYLNTEHRGIYGKMCVVFDSKPYWRKEAFEHYKAGRKPLGDEMHWGIINEIEVVLHEHSPWKIMSIPTLEADDIIGVLAREIGETEKCLIISPDSDFGQLQGNPNIDQIDIIRARDMECKNPSLFLQEKIIGGDKKDGIPNILSDDDTFVCKEKRQKPMTQKRKREFVNTDTAFWENKEAVKRFKQNELLIDLSKIPDDIQRNIRYTYALQPTTGKKNLRKYFIANRMAQQADTIRNFL